MTMTNTDASRVQQQPGGVSAREVSADAMPMIPMMVAMRCQYQAACRAHRSSPSRVSTAFLGSRRAASARPQSSADSVTGVEPVPVVGRHRPDEPSRFRPGLFERGPECCARAG